MATASPDGRLGGAKGSGKAVLKLKNDRPGAQRAAVAMGTRMRCYFHLVNGSEEIRDREGLEVADLDQAHAEALETLHALAREDEAAAAWAGWRLDVCDASGALLFSIGLDGTGAIH